ncbi:hypothetical protein ACGFIW_01905 [Micromonospora sp. NPDC048935]|uniref:hypothetical protein n=1 Tax=Micromonospora sp. NPDC048935 TaxID=3364262 RepID=UPI0037200D0C
MTASTMARPSIGAGPAPRNQDNTMTDYRTYERLINAINAGRIRRNPFTYEYVDDKGKFSNLDLLIFHMEDCGWVRLHIDGRIEVTRDGEAWMGRTRRGSKAPEVAFSDQPGAA